MFRDSLSQHSSHYSLLQTYTAGIAQQYRSCLGCSTVHYGAYNRYSSVWFRVVKEGNVMKAFYKPSESSKVDPWYPFGYQISMNSISSNGYYIGVAVTSRSNSQVATMRVSNIELTRTCSSATITQLQCDQASNCDQGQASGACYNKGEVPSWEHSEPVKSIFDIGSTVTSFGCESGSAGNKATDESTNKFECVRTAGVPSGLVIVPSHRRRSIAEGLRVYAQNNCPGCDPVSYTFEGREKSDLDWVLISEGDLPWKTATPTRNSLQGLDISSTYTSGDSSFSFTEISFSDDTSTLNEYLEYKITWTATRGTQNLLQLAEVEVPGLLGEEPPMPTLDFSGAYVNSIIKGSTEIELVNAYSSVSLQNALSGNTYKFSMERENAEKDPGMQISPSHGYLSVVTGLRIYTANNNPKADPIKYRIEGKGLSGANINTRVGSLCWQYSDYWLGLAICDSTSTMQKFYLNAIGEIHVQSHPDLCLDPRYAPYYRKWRFIACYSTYYGPDHYAAQWQQFTLDTATEQIRSNYYGQCAQDENGYVSQDYCNSASARQKFFSTDGNFDIVSQSLSWTFISEGSIPWISEFDRNPLGVGISSNYEDGDEHKFFMEVKFYESKTPFFQYQIYFPEVRDSDHTSIQFAELELPGLLIGAA